MIRTFIDSGVLIDAARGEGSEAECAMNVLVDPGRLLLTSMFVRLEVYPKVKFNPFHLQRAFLNEFFMDPALEWARDLSLIVQMALSVAEDYGLAAMDALHIAAALMLNAQQFVTTEKPGRPLYRVDALQVVPVREAAGSQPITSSAG